MQARLPVDGRAQARRAPREAGQIPGPRWRSVEARLRAQPWCAGRPLAADGADPLRGARPDQPVASARGAERGAEGGWQRLRPPRASQCRALVGVVGRAQRVVGGRGPGRQARPARRRSPQAPLLGPGVGGLPSAGRRHVPVQREVYAPWRARRPLWRACGPGRGPGLLRGPAQGEGVAGAAQGGPPEIAAADAATVIRWGAAPFSLASSPALPCIALSAGPEEAGQHDGETAAAPQSGSAAGRGVQKVSCSHAPAWSQIGPLSH